MLYTRKGDKGDTSFFGCNQQFSKNSVLAEALGSIDELNSFLGLCKVRARIGANLTQSNANKNIDIPDVIERVQQNLFIIQANLAGAGKKISRKKISDLEKIIDGIEKELPSIKSFFISGGTELSALFDYARAISRRVERRAVAYSESEKEKISPEILVYLNRLSSLFYALVRICNLKSGVKEKSPSYK